MNDEEVAREIHLKYLQEDILVIILDPAHLHVVVQVVAQHEERRELLEKAQVQPERVVPVLVQVGRNLLQALAKIVNPLPRTQRQG